jgi:hypothetical protein
VSIWKGDPDKLRKNIDQAKEFWDKARQKPAPSPPPRGNADGDTGRTNGPGDSDSYPTESEINRR